MITLLVILILQVRSFIDNNGVDCQDSVPPENIIWPNSGINSLQGGGSLQSGPCIDNMNMVSDQYNNDKLSANNSKYPSLLGNINNHSGLVDLLRNNLKCDDRVSNQLNNNSIFSGQGPFQGQNQAQGLFRGQGLFNGQGHPCRPLERDQNSVHNLFPSCIPNGNQINEHSTADCLAQLQASLTPPTQTVTVTIPTPIYIEKQPQYQIPSYNQQVKTYNAYQTPQPLSTMGGGQVIPQSIGYPAQMQPGIAYPNAPMMYNQQPPMGIDPRYAGMQECNFGDPNCNLQNKMIQNDANCTTRNGCLPLKKTNKKKLSKKSKKIEVHCTCKEVDGGLEDCSCDQE